MSSTALVSNDDLYLQAQFGSGIWPRNPRIALTRFLYLRDRLFLLACGLYALNRWLLKPHLANRFLHNQFNDTLLIPCALPPLLMVQRRLGLRQMDGAPTAGEVTFHLLIWSILFEMIGPHIMRGTVGDPWDVVAYAAGAICAWLWWQRPRLPRATTG